MVKGTAPGSDWRAYTHSPASCNASMPRGRLLVWHTVRCSTAPAEAFTTAGVTSTCRLSSITTAMTPTASAERSNVPKFWGSWIESSSSTSAFGPASRHMATTSASVLYG